MRAKLKLLYFSLNPHSTNAFQSYIKRTLQDRRNSFSIDSVNKNNTFKHASDLTFFLEDQRDLENFYVIIDYLSFYNCHLDDQTGEEDEKNKKNKVVITDKIKGDKAFSVEQASKIIARTILRYPEVMFLFDESWKETNKEDVDFTDFIFFKGCDDVSSIAKQYHQYRVFEKQPFAFIQRKWNNLYDGSNLRFAIKRYLYERLCVEQRNFERIQSSRSSHLAICVEEEHTQTLFNSYALYANGFRVWPIMSAYELKDFNEDHKKHKDLKLIIRDYDIQFPDANEDDSESELKIVGKKDDENLIDYIRGAKYLDNEKKWRALDTNSEGPNGGKNHFWNQLQGKPHYFISKGVDHIKFITSKQRYHQKQPNNGNGLFQNEKEWQYLRGLHKPVTGIYSSMHNFEEIKTCYDEAVRWTEEMRHKEKTYFIQTARKEHHHGVPLDIYDLTKGMIDRARKYQKDGKFVISAMVAQEAIEILNGFHESLMLKAYHIYAVSENAICMNLLGGNEQWLKEDAIFRINKIRHDVTRMLARKQTNKDRKDLQLNVLNQIFSDCREFCYKKEHFLSEDAFVSAMAYLNDGWDIARAWRENIKYPTDIKIDEKIENIKKQIIGLSDKIREAKGNDANNTNSMSIWLKTKNILGTLILELKYFWIAGKLWRVYDINDLPTPRQDLTWSSSNEKVAKIEDGKLDPKSSGHAVIFVYNRSMLDCYPVEVCLQEENV